MWEYSDKVRAYDRAQTNKNLKKRSRSDETPDAETPASASHNGFAASPEQSRYTGTTSFAG